MTSEYDAHARESGDEGMDTSKHSVGDRGGFVKTLRKRKTAAGQGDRPPNMMHAPVTTQSAAMHAPMALNHRPIGHIPHCTSCTPR